MQIMQYVSIMYFCFFLNFLYCRKYTKVFQKQNIIADMSWTASQKMTCRQHPRHHPHRIASVNRAHHVHNDTKRPRNAVATAVSSFATVISLHVYFLFIFSLFKVYTCKYLPYVCPMRSHVKEKYIKISISLFCNLDGEC